MPLVAEVQLEWVQVEQIKDICIHILGCFNKICLGRKGLITASNCIHLPKSVSIDLMIQIQF